VRLGAGAALCVRTLDVDRDPAITGRLTALLGKPRPDCTLTLRVTHERAHGLRVTGGSPGKPSICRPTRRH